MFNAIQRKDLRDQSLAIPALNLNDGTQVQIVIDSPVSAIQPEIVEDAFYNTFLVFNGIPYAVQSIDLEDHFG